MLIQLLTIAVLAQGPVESPSPRVTSDPARAPKTDTPHEPHIGTLGITGATMAAASIGVLIAGTVNLTSGSFDPRFAYEVRYTRGSGRALVGLGVVGVATGLTVLAWDLAFRGRGRLRGGVNVSPTSGGVWLTGRF